MTLPSGSARGFLALLLLPFLPLPSRADSFPVPRIAYAPRHYVCLRAARPPVIDGRLDEEAWKKAPETEPFVDIEGEGKPAPRFATRVRMLWDDEYLYVAANLEEPDLWATLTERDAVIYHDHDFEVFIDPDADTHEYYELEINALGTVWDLLLLKPYRDGGPAVNAWDIRGLKSAVFLDGTLNQPDDRDRGWSVELAFPWSVLAECAHRPSPPKDGDCWKVNFSRVEWRLDLRSGKSVKALDPRTGKPFPEDNWVWSPQGLVAMHYPEMWGWVKFSNGSDRSLDFDPTGEDERWALRRVYYGERGFFSEHRSYSAGLREIGLLSAEEALGVTGGRKGRLSGWPPVIEATDDLFEARLRAPERGGFFRITEDGRIVFQAEPSGEGR